jgi:hypothetical protein
MLSRRSRPRAARVQRRAPAGSAGAHAIRAAAVRPAVTRAALLGGAWLGALAALSPRAAHAVDATWTAPLPGPGEWTTGTNWTGGTVPDNTATFTTGTATTVTISNNAAINTIEFAAAAPAYAFTVQNGANGQQHRQHVVVHAGLQHQQRCDAGDRERRLG